MFSHRLQGSVLLLSLLAAGCNHSDTSADWSCYLPGERSSANAAGNDELAVHIEELNISRYWLWGPTRRAISVCWEDESFESGDFVTYRQWVRDAVTQQWENTLATLEDGTPVPESLRVRFVGWTRCSEGFNDGIRILVNEERPSAWVGTYIAGRLNGMNLNFRFSTWSPSCNQFIGSIRERCIKSIAVHEFGHALGFNHEQDRIDRDPSCIDELYGDGDLYGGAWDLSSVMNYCNPDWNNHGQLSPNDARWARVAYYPEYYADLICTPVIRN